MKNDQARKNDAERMRSHEQDPKFRKKRDEAATKTIRRLNADPEFKERNVAAQRTNALAQHQDPEFERKRIEGLKARWRDPDFRKRHAKALAKRPTGPEAVFYGLILGDPTIAKGFTAQQDDGVGVYDGAWLEQNIIVELDGGGHHIHRDRHAEDARKDLQRAVDGNATIRATTAGELYLKALAILSV